MSETKEITQEEFMQLVDELAKVKPTLQLLTRSVGGYEKWGKNVHQLIDKELGITRVEKILRTI